MNITFPDRPGIMGILNVTPDSFSDGGDCPDAQSAIAKARRLWKDSADIIDIGGESTGPGTTTVPVSEELRRLEQVVEVLSKEMLVSIDTYKSKVASRCLELGAKMINDVSALRADKDMASVVADHKAFVVLMYSKELDDSPHASNIEVEVEDRISTIIEFLKRRIDYALSNGIEQDKLILDPGMGRFLSSKPEESFNIIVSLSRLKASLSGFPLLIGVSRKGFLNSVLPDADLHERDALSQFLAFLAQQNGADIIRTHNVRLATAYMRILQKLK